MKVKDLIKETFSLKGRIEALTATYEKNRKLLQKAFDEKKIDKISVDGEDSIVEATKIQKIQINYFVDKLEGKLDKEMLNEVIQKSYSVSDMNGLVKLLKKSGVNPSEFKQFILVNKSVDKDRLKSLFEVGDIKIEQLAGCYEAKIVKYIDLKSRKGDSD